MSITVTWYGIWWRKKKNQRYLGFRCICKRTPWSELHFGFTCFSKSVQTFPVNRIPDSIARRRHAMLLKFQKHFHYPTKVQPCTTILSTDLRVNFKSWVLLFMFIQKKQKKTTTFIYAFMSFLLFFHHTGDRWSRLFQTTLTSATYSGLLSDTQTFSPHMGDVISWASPGFAPGSPSSWTCLIQLYQ